MHGWESVRSDGRHVLGGLCRVRGWVVLGRHSSRVQHLRIRYIPRVLKLNSMRFVFRRKVCSHRRENIGVCVLELPSRERFGYSG